MMRTTANSAIILCLIVFGSTFAARADVWFYTSESEWGDDNGGPATVFPFSAHNVALADEVTTPPAYNTYLGPQITFQSTNTGMPQGFRFVCDIAGQQVVYVNNSLGASATSHHDWSIEVFPFQVYCVGLRLHTGSSTQANHLRVYDRYDNLLGSYTPIPVGDVFLGVISDTPLARVLMDDTTSSGGIVATALLLTEASTSAVPDDEFTAKKWGGIKSLYRHDQSPRR